jgi:hypothetical protein
MCDKGILEYQPDAMKLEYCIVINDEIQKRIVDGISKLLGKSVVIAIEGVYKKENISVI